MIQFKESFFEEEIRNGFCIKPMMKRAWAAQMEVLIKIDEVCRRNSIRYFANWGTLLGTVRHKGFIPWDDDIDIVMLRTDYQKFCQVAVGQLPEEYSLVNVFEDGNYDNMIARVVNSRRIACDKVRLEAFHGCPYVVGVDIDILDYRSRKPDEDKLQLDLLKIVLESVSVVKKYKNESISEHELKIFLSQIESLCHYKFDYDKSLHQQLYMLGEYIRMLYADEDADEVQGTVYRILHRPNYFLPKEWYSEVIYMPFEDVMELPVPKAYDSVLRQQYGDYYMTPNNQGCGHGYPFYAAQEEQLAHLLKAHHLSGKQFYIDLDKYE